MEIKVNFKRKLKLAPAIGDWTIIDHFLEDKESEEADITQIKDPNFDSLPQESLNYLHYFHYRFFERSLNLFAKLANVKIDFHSIEITQLSAKAFQNYIDGEVVQGEINLEGIGKTKLILGKTLSEVIINRLLGGKGLSTGRQKFTDLDFSILARAFKNILPIFQGIWKDIVSPNPEDFSVHKGPYLFDQKTSKRDAYIFFKARFSFSNDDQLCNLILVYPNYVLRQLLKKKALLEDPMKKSVELSPKTLSKIFVPVSVCLGETVLAMSEIQNLQVGDVITLETDISDPVILKIDPEVSLYVQPGVKNRKTCVQIINQEQASAALNDYIPPKRKETKSSVKKMQEIDSGISQSRGVANTVDTATIEAVEVDDQNASHTQDTEIVDQEMEVATPPEQDSAIEEVDDFPEAAIEIEPEEDESEEAVAYETEADTETVNDELADTEALDAVVDDSVDDEESDDEESDDEEEDFSWDNL